MWMGARERGHGEQVACQGGNVLCAELCVAGKCMLLNTKTDVLCTWLDRVGMCFALISLLHEEQAIKHLGKSAVRTALQGVGVLCPCNTQCRVRVRVHALQIDHELALCMRLHALEH